jgi:myo-inositol 2-dehydrogenase/D-chiro-inositol 1-dehydrogenase
MKMAINIGVLGAGRIGKVHGQNVLNIPGVKLVTIVDPFISDEMVEWAKSNDVKSSKEAEDIFSDESIDAVLICSSSNTHAEFIVRAAQAKKHIFCEKPIDYDTDRIKETLAIVEKSGVKLQVGFMRRFDHNHRRVHDEIVAGKIGVPHILHISSRDPEAPPLDYVKRCGGFFFDMTIHDFDLARYLVGSEITEVYALGAARIDEKVAEIGDIDTALVTIKFENGCFGTIDNSRETHYGYVQRNEVFGSLGSIEVFDDKPDTVRISTNEGVSIAKPQWWFMNRYNDAFRAEIEAFVDCIKNDTEPYVTGIDGLIPALCAKACVKSLQEGRPVKLSEIE